MSAGLRLAGLDVHCMTTPAPCRPRVRAHFRTALKARTRLPIPSPPVACKRG